MPPPIFARFSLILKFDNPIEYPPSGKALHGLAFRYIKAADPDIADRIHKSENKPFTLSLLRRDRNNPDIAIWHWTILDFELYQKVSALFYHEWSTKKQRSIDTKDFIIEEVTMDGGGFSELLTPDDLLLHTIEFLERCSGFPYYALRIITPAAFKITNGTIGLFPEPRLVWGSLERRLRKFCPAFVRYLDEPLNWDELYVTEYRLRTRQLDFPDFKMKGTTGTIVYAPPEKWSDKVIFASTLLYFAAQFLGIGTKTSQGMGSCIRLNRKFQSDN